MDKLPIAEVPQVAFQKLCSYLDYKDRLVLRGQSRTLRDKVDDCWHVREKWKPLVKKYGLPKTASYYGPMSEVAAFLPEDAQKRLFELIKPGRLTATLVQGRVSGLSEGYFWKVELQLLGPTFRFCVMAEKMGAIVTFSPSAPTSSFVYINPEGKRYATWSIPDLREVIAELLTSEVTERSADIAIPENVRAGHLPEASREELGKMEHLRRQLNGMEALTGVVDRLRDRLRVEFRNAERQGRQAEERRKTLIFLVGLTAVACFTVWYSMLIRRGLLQQGVAATT